MATRPRRNFDPRMTARFGRPTLSPDILVKYSPRWQYSRLMNFPFRGSHFRPRTHTVVVSIDGGSRCNDRSNPDARAAYGVFFGHNCPRNAFGCLDRDLPQTNGRAELEALRQALKIVEGMYHAGEFLGKYREVIIKTDATYVAKSMEEWIWSWINTGGKRSNGKAVEHWSFMQDLHRTICGFEQQYNISVRFWTVRREWNKEADALVNLALDRACDSGYES